MNCAFLGWNWCVSYQFVFPNNLLRLTCIVRFRFLKPAAPHCSVTRFVDFRLIRSAASVFFPDRSCCSQCEAAARLDESTVVMNYWATLKMNISYGSRRVGNASPNPWCPFRSWSRPSPAPVCTLMQVPLPPSPPPNADLLYWCESREDPFTLQWFFSHIEVLMMISLALQPLID